MTYRKLDSILTMFHLIATYANAQINPDKLQFKTFVFKSETLSDFPFTQSNDLSGIKFPARLLSTYAR